MSVHDLSSAFTDATPGRVNAALMLQPHDRAQIFCIQQVFNVLLPITMQEGNDVITARKNTVDLMIQHLKPRYDLYQTFVNLHFPDWREEQKIYMVTALLADTCLSRMNPHTVPEDLPQDLVLRAYEIQRQTIDLSLDGETKGPIIPESLFLAQIENIGTIETMEPYLESYSMEEIERHTKGTILPCARIADASTPAGRCLYDAVVRVTNKIEAKVGKPPELQIVP